MPENAPTRTHNTDVANSTIETRNLWSRTKGETVEMGIANASAIYAMLSDLSATPGNYVIREAYSNAYDATLRSADMNAAIEIELPPENRFMEERGVAAKLMNPNATTHTLTVTDHGCGMSRDEVCANFLQYGGSDKTDEIDSIGSKGLGAKAPLAIADSFDVTTTKDGITTHAHITRRPKQAGQASVYTEQTGADSGTTVTIPIASDDLVAQMWQFVHSLEMFATSANIIVNGKKISAKLSRKKGALSGTNICLGEIEVETNPPTKMLAWQAYDTENLRYRSFPRKCFGENDYISINAIVGGVAYPINNRNLASADFIVEVEPGWLDFTPSRDEIKKCEATDKFEATLKRALEKVDVIDVLDEHIRMADTATLVNLRARSYVFDHNSIPNNLSTYRGKNIFMENPDGTCSVRIHNEISPISRQSFDRMQSVEISLDNIVLSHVGRTNKAHTSVNGHSKPKREAEKFFGFPDADATMDAIGNRHTTPNVITGICSVDDATWVLRNEATLRNIGLVKWDKTHASIILVDDLANIAEPMRSLLSGFNTISLVAAKNGIARENAAKRQQRKATQSLSSTRKVAQPWHTVVANIAPLPRNVSDEELVLWALQPHLSNTIPMPETLFLNKVATDANRFAIALVDAEPTRGHKAQNAAVALALALKKDPTCVPDTVAYVITTDAKRLQTKEFNAMMRQGAFLFADRRTKVKSARHDGLADLRQDLVEADESMNVTADCSGITDDALVARLLQFCLGISSKEAATCESRVAKLAADLLDESQLTGDALMATQNLHELFSQYQVIKNRHNYGYHSSARAMQLCGTDIMADNLRSTWSNKGTASINLKNMSQKSRQMLLDASQISNWFRSMMETLGVTLSSYETEDTQERLDLLATLSPVLSAHMAANFTRKVI